MIGHWGKDGASHYDVIWDINNKILMLSKEFKNKQDDFLDFLKDFIKQYNTMYPPKK